MEIQYLKRMTSQNLNVGEQDVPSEESAKDVIIPPLPQSKCLFTFLCVIFSPVTTFSLIKELLC